MKFLAKWTHCLTRWWLTRTFLSTSGHWNDGDDLGAAAAVAVGAGGDAVAVVVVVVVFAEPIVSGASLIGRNNADENWRQNFGFSLEKFPFYLRLKRSKENAKA